MHRIRTGETLEMQDLNDVWALMSRRYGEVYGTVRTDPPNVLTAKKFDESQPGGRRVYFAVDRLLGVAIENHEALLTVLEHYGVSPAAPWSMLRPVFETSFYAAWVMDPDDGRKRRQRGLRAEVVDHKARNAYLREFVGLPEVSGTVKKVLKSRVEGPEKVYRDEAQQLHLTWQAVSQRISVIDELPTLSFLQAQDNLTRSMFVAQWRLLSGYQHGLGWAMLAGSDQTVHATIPGGREIQVTVNDQAFVAAAKATAWMFLQALARRERLHNRTL